MVYTLTVHLYANDKPESIELLKQKLIEAAKVYRKLSRSLLPRRASSLEVQSLLRQLVTFKALPIVTTIPLKKLILEKAPIKRQSLGLSCKMYTILGHFLL